MSSPPACTGGSARRRMARTTRAPASCRWSPASTEWRACPTGRCVTSRSATPRAGAMAEQTVIDLRQSFELPDGADPVLVAAAMNPAMSSWVALRAADRLVRPARPYWSWAPPAARVRWPSKSPSASAQASVIAAGRNPERLAALPELGADTVVRLGETPGLGGGGCRRRRGHRLPVGTGHRRRDDGYRHSSPRSTARPLIWIEIGSVAGLDRRDPVGGAARAAPADRGQRAGIGVATAAILAELPALVDEIASGALRIDARAVPLADVTTAWQDTAPTRGSC